MIDSPAGAAGAARQTSLENAVQAAVLKKTLDVQKIEGQAVLDLIEKSAVPSTPYDPAKGRLIDVYA